MNGHRVVGALFLAMAAGALAPSAIAMKDATPSSIETTYGKLPARLCLAADAAQWKRLRDGSGRLSLEVRNHVPAARYSPTFSVRVAADGGKGRAEARRFGLAIDRVTNEGKAEPQHFAFDLSGELAGRPDAPRICVDVDVDHDGDDAKALASTGVTLIASWSAP